MEGDLFYSNSSDNHSFKSPSQNLAARMRPQNLEDFYGQSHILGKGKLLRRLVESDKFSALLFYGAPGTGKTTLAHIIARIVKDHFQILNGVTSSVSDIRKCVTQAKERWHGISQRTLVLVDEIHRFNKSQQDALLPHVEEGWIRIIGATTENPFFTVTSALISRMQLFEFHPLEIHEIITLLENIIAKNVLPSTEVSFNIDIDHDALLHLAKVCEGDARKALNALEIAALTTPVINNKIYLSLDTIEQSIQIKSISYDQDGDQHYDTISAFIKSIRGSEPDAALYWLAKMLEAGEDIRFISRRLVISAAEDIGLADPQALVVASACQNTVERIGMPEARIVLSETALYLATAPKSNSSYTAIEAAISDIKEGRTIQVPVALKDSHYKGAATLGRGEGYQYAHAYKDGITPDLMTKNIPSYYQPASKGYEKVIQERLEKWSAYRKTH